MNDPDQRLSQYSGFVDVWRPIGHPLRMTATFDQAQHLVASLPRQERARLFVWMAEDMADQHPGIEFDPRVCGGSARIAGTRIPVWSLESWRRLGSDEAELLRNFPSLMASDLVNAWRYVERHTSEIDREIDENEMAE
jgi:uncharacterized protein (DUF433 family)